MRTHTLTSSILACALALATTCGWAQTAAQPYMVVTPCSAVMRLPTAMPSDGQVTDTLALVATPGEYESASFVITPGVPVAKLVLQPSELTAAGGRIPAANIDIRVVACWYQAGTAWQSAFQSPGRRIITPELLLHDATLVKVDPAKGQNAVRVAGQTYVNVEALGAETVPMKDAAALQPVALAQGMTQQFWVTVHVPAAQAEGLYTGKITLTADGKPLPPLAMSVRVLPFTLPMPGTYYDPNRPFFSAMLGGGQLGAGRTEAQLLAEYRNRLAHNDLYAVTSARGDEAAFRQTLAVRKEAGLPTKPLILTDVPGGTATDAATLDEDAKRVQRLLEIVQEVYGHRDVYIFGDGTQPAYWQRLNAMGAKVATTSDAAGEWQDWHQQPGLPQRALAGRWHAATTLIANSAAPFSGPENPELMRRNHGMLVYKANYDGTMNQAYYTDPLVWNDFRPGTYRARCVVYPTQDGVIDTLAWEGYREGIDDVRYATLLKQLAAQGMASKAYATQKLARTALHWLEITDERTADLDAMRLEMINYILQLRAAMNPA